tara:strand:- start:27 stop:218 length:192 start_codon:yes stop_codon:yes gene_type:complete
MMDRLEDFVQTRMEQAAQAIDDAPEYSDELVPRGRYLALREVLEAISINKGADNFVAPITCDA